MNELNEKILELATKAGACAGALRQIPRLNVEQLLKLYVDNLDFAVGDGKNVFTGDVLKNYATEAQLNAVGIYVDERAILTNLTSVVLLGKCEYTLQYDNNSVGEVYILDNCKGTIDLMDKAFMFVNIYDNATLSIIGNNTSTGYVMQRSEAAKLTTVNLDSSEIIIKAKWKNQL